MNVNELKKGAMLSYFLIIANTFYGLFFTPFLISSLGDGEYGVYKIIGSLIGSLSILDLGIGSTVLRYTAQFRAEKDEKRLSNFAAMSLVQAAILSVVMMVFCAVVFFQIDNVYSDSLSIQELAKAKELFVLFAVILVLNTFEKVLFSLIAGSEHYTFANSMKLMRIVLKLFLSILILHHITNSAVLLIIDLILLMCTMFVQFWYIRKKIKIDIHFSYWDGDLFKSTFKYTILMFIQSIVVQFNGNLDNMVIGAVVNSVTVAVYSIGLQLYNMYEQFALAFSDLMLPTVSRQIAEGATNKELEDTVIKVGRLEFMVLGGVLCGYIMIGKEFINLWLGNGYDLAWYVGLILMVPTTVPLIQNVCLSILRAKNKMLFRTIVVCVMAIFNLIFTLIGVKYFGAIAACIGTAIGLIGANIIAMNIYYVKEIKLNIFRIFSNILNQTWICCVLAVFILYLVDVFIKGTWINWLIKVFVFVIVYGILLLLFGFRDYEKNYVIRAIEKIIKRK